jgi:hypothetical protein
LARLIAAGFGDVKGRIDPQPINPSAWALTLLSRLPAKAARNITAEA